MSHLCIAEQPCRWSRQSKVSALLLHIRGGLVSMARCHSFPPGNAAIFKEAGSLGVLIQWQTNDRRTGTSACAETFPILSASLTHRQAWRFLVGLLVAAVHCCLCFSKALIKMEWFDRNDWLKWNGFDWTSCKLEQYRDDVCSTVRRGGRLFKRKVPFCVKAQRCSNDLCFSVWEKNEKDERFFHVLHNSGV